MLKLKFTKEINAPARVVYETMLGLNKVSHYEDWTAVFNPKSTYEGSWEKGSKIKFIGVDEEGKKGGMLSEIADHKPNKFVSIRHCGIVDGENEITKGPEVEKWAGGLENYAFEEENGTTRVTVEIDVTREHVDYFEKTWPKALDKLQNLVEG